MSESVFEGLQAEIAQGGIPAAFERLANQLREDERYHDLFDARLMQRRCELGLPAISSQSLDDLPEEHRLKVEDAYLEVCREVGTLLLDAGRIREAWMYLRPAGEKSKVSEALAKIEPDEENIEEFIEVAVHEGVAPALGFGLVLEHYGTCNAITMFDAAIQTQSPQDRREVALCLVKHLHQELLENLKSEVAREEGTEPPETTVAELVADRDWLFLEDNYHIDTSHLQSVVRFARLLDDPTALRLALDLTEYGRRLSPHYQFQGDEPFAETYPAHAVYYKALLGEEVEEAVQYFRDKAQSKPVYEQGTGPAEVYIALLAQLGRYEEALNAMAELIPSGVELSGLAPSLLELGKKSGNFERLMEICQERGDVLGYAAGLVESKLAAGNAPAST